MFENWCFPWQANGQKIIVRFFDLQKKVIAFYNNVSFDSLKLNETFIEFTSEFSTKSASRTELTSVRFPTRFVRYFEAIEHNKKESSCYYSLSFFVDLNLESVGSLGANLTLPLKHH